MDSQQLALLVGIAVAIALIAVIAVVVVRRGRKGAELPPSDEKAVPEKPEAGKPEAGKAPARIAPVEKEKPRAWSEGLAKTRGGFVARIAGLLGRKEIDPTLLDQLEEILFTADIGVKTSHRLFEAVKARLDREHLRDPAAVWDVIQDESRKLLTVDRPALDVNATRPFVILTIGVNGVGKTTTIGKLAARYAAEGKRVLLAAGDTFRAAATEQLEIWGQRAGVPVVKGKEGGDPSAVIYDAVKRGKEEGYDLVICDTAGRLHTKSDLMQELQKVRRVIQKVDASAPHETLLVLDSTNGQNAILQAQLFKEAMSITGIVLTKLDGTAKGGVILGICDDLRIPVRFVGIGEKVADLREFDPGAFVDALFEREEAA